jgi:hypothetical protein
METERKQTKERGFEDIIISLHPKFLKAVQETYYLAVLGSLCIAVSAFTQQTYAQAQAYAITGASLFLLAFVCSLSAKIFPSSFLILPSYLSTGGGVFMLFLVVTEFIYSINIVSKAFLTIVLCLGVALLASLPFNLYNSVKKSTGKAKFFLILSVIFLTITTISFAMLIPSVALNPNIFPPWLNQISANILLVFPLASLATIIIAIPLKYLERKSNKNQGQSRNKSLIEEGSGI